MADTAEIARLLKRSFPDALANLDVPHDLDLVEAGFIDSFALVTIVAALEKAFPGLRIADSDATVENLASVDRIAGYLAARGVG